MKTNIEDIKYTNNNGVSFLGLLCLIFITLKLTHVINWSWWLVLMPVWVDLIIITIVVIILCIVNKL